MSRITAQTLADLIANLDSDGVAGGSLLFLRSGNRTSRDRPTGAVKEFLDEMWERHRSQVKPSRTVHPETAAGAPGRAITVRRAEGEDLTPAELVWLQRLPLDPAQVSHGDAARLAALHHSLATAKSPSSKHLVESVWLPVKEVFDERVAREQIQEASRSTTPLPYTAGNALTQVIADEQPDWPAEAVNAHANALLAEAQQRRDTARERVLSSAQAKLDAATRSKAERTALTKVSA